MEDASVRKINAAIAALVAIAAIVLIVSFLSSRTAGRAPSASVPAGETAEAVSEPQEFSDLNGMAALELAKDFASWTPGARVDAAKTRTATLSVEGAPRTAYLSVRASKDGKPLTKYESLYVKFNDAGGHVFRPKTLEVPASETATVLLYDLSAMPYLPSVPYDEKREPQTADLKALLADGRRVRLTAFISSLSPALIEEMTLHYACAEGATCAVTLQ